MTRVAQRRSPGPDWAVIFSSIGAEAQRKAARWYGTEKARKPLGKGAGGDTTVWLDRALEDIVIKRLRQAGDIRLVTEEAGALEFGKPRAIVFSDPLDGSTNAKLGIPFFSISLAASETDNTLGGITYGYVRNLVTGQEYTAWRGSGAYLGTRKLMPSSRKNLNLVSLEFHPHTSYNLKKAFTIMKGTDRIRSLGSIALDLCLVASGAFEGIVDCRKRIRALDIAAAALILREAGGILSQSDGTPLDDTIIDTTGRVNFVAANNPTTHKKLLSLCRAR